MFLHQLFRSLLIYSSFKCELIFSHSNFAESCCRTWITFGDFCSFLCGIPTHVTFPFCVHSDAVQTRNIYFASQFICQYCCNKCHRLHSLNNACANNVCFHFDFAQCRLHQVCCPVCVLCSIMTVCLFDEKDYEHAESVDAKYQTTSLTLATKAKSLAACCCTTPG